MEEWIDAIRAEETHLRDLAERQADPKKKLLYKSIADVAALKANELRLLHQNTLTETPPRRTSVVPCAE